MILKRNISRIILNGFFFYVLTTVLEISVFVDISLFEIHKFKQFLQFKKKKKNCSDITFTAFVESKM